MKVGTALCVVGLAAVAAFLVYTGHGDAVGWAVAAVLFLVAFFGL